MNVMKNPIGEHGLAMLLSAIENSAVKTNSGMAEGQASLDWSNQGLKPFDLNMLATDISFSPFTPVPSEVNLSVEPKTGSEYKYGRKVGGVKECDCDRICGSA